MTTTEAPLLATKLRPPVPPAAILLPFCHHFVLAGEDPPFPLARLRAHGRLVEVRADDLRFHVDEAEAYFSAAGLVLARDELERVVDRTEGWIAGLQLASLAIARAPNAAVAVAALGRNQRFRPKPRFGPEGGAQAALRRIRRVRLAFRAI